MSRGRGVGCHPRTLKYTYKYDWEKERTKYFTVRECRKQQFISISCALGQWQFNTRPVDVKEIKTEQTGPGQSRFSPESWLGPELICTYNRSTLYCFSLPWICYEAKFRAELICCNDFKLLLRYLNALLSFLNAWWVILKVYLILIAVTEIMAIRFSTCAAKYQP